MGRAGTVQTRHLANARVLSNPGRLGTLVHLREIAGRLSQGAGAAQARTPSLSMLSFLKGLLVPKTQLVIGKENPRAV